MRKLHWKQCHADLVLEALVNYMKVFPTTSTRHRALRATFRDLGNLILAGDRFSIEVDERPGKTNEILDERFQRVCTTVRDRRRAAREGTDGQAT